MLIMCLILAGLGGIKPLQAEDQPPAQTPAESDAATPPGDTPATAEKEAESVKDPEHKDEATDNSSSPSVPTEVVAPAAGGATPPTESTDTSAKTTAPSENPTLAAPAGDAAGPAPVEASAPPDTAPEKGRPIRRFIAERREYYSQHRNPLIAGLLSFTCPGAGQFYNKDYLLGGTYLLGGLTLGLMPYSFEDNHLSPEEMGKSFLLQNDLAILSLFFGSLPYFLQNPERDRFRVQSFLTMRLVWDVGGVVQAIMSASRSNKLFIPNERRLSSWHFVADPTKDTLAAFYYVKF
jgi:hypothetical protein